MGRLNTKKKHDFGEESKINNQKIRWKKFSATFIINLQKSYNISLSSSFNYDDLFFPSHFFMRLNLQFLESNCRMSISDHVLILQRKYPSIVSTRAHCSPNYIQNHVFPSYIVLCLICANQSRSLIIPTCEDTKRGYPTKLYANIIFRS